MKKLVFLCAITASHLSNGADWKYAVMGGQEERAIYVDNSQYLYDKKTNTIKAWFKTIGYTDSEGKETYTKSKDLYKFSCLDSKMKLLAYVNYSKNGEVVSSAQLEDRDTKYSITIPDTIGEDMWKVACLTKGGGFKYPKWQTGERLTREEMEKIFPNGFGNSTRSQEEIDELNRNFSPQ